MKNLFLFDLDNTLFDSASYRKKLFENIKEACDAYGIAVSTDYLQDVYNEQIKKYGLFDPAIFIESVFPEEIEKVAHEIKDLIFNSVLLQEHFHKDVFLTFKNLSEIGEIGIFSQGEESLQKAKINHLLNVIHKDRIHIERDKKAELQKVFQKYKTYNIYFIDDMLPLLHAAKIVSPIITTIWIKRGRYAEVQKDIEGFSPDYTVAKLDEAVTCIKKSLKKNV